MTFSHRPKEPLPEVETKIWVCSSEDCKGWMRDSYSFAETPTCPLCHSEMQEETKVLPKLR